MPTPAGPPPTPAAPVTSRAAVLARARRFAEAGMVDACTIRRTYATTVDDFSGTSTPTYAYVYIGKCRFQALRPMARPHDVGEDFLLLLRLDLQLPMSVTGLRSGDVVTCTSSVTDQDLVDRVFLVHDLFHKTDATARRVQITERTAS